MRLILRYTLLVSTVIGLSTGYNTGQRGRPKTPFHYIPPEFQEEEEEYNPPPPPTTTPEPTTERPSSVPTTRKPITRPPVPRDPPSRPPSRPFAFTPWRRPSPVPPPPYNPNTRDYFDHDHEPLAFRSLGPPDPSQARVHEFQLPVQGRNYEEVYFSRSAPRRQALQLKAQDLTYEGARERALPDNGYEVYDPYAYMQRRSKAGSAYSQMRGRSWSRETIY